MEHKRTEEETGERFRELLEAHGRHREDGGQEALLRLLRETQLLLGHLPKEAQEKIADAMGVKLPVIAALVKRIPDLKEEKALHEITVCTGPRCSEKGSPALLKTLEKELGIRPGMVTKDGKFRLTTQMCFKKCGNAPNVRIDGTIYGQVREETLLNLLNQTRKDLKS